VKNYLVLSDNTLKEFYNFKHNKKCNNTIVQNLLHYYKTHLTNVAQLKRIGIYDTILMQQLLQNGYTTQTLEILAKQTLFQVILDIDRSDYPYLCISKDKIENNFTSSYDKDEIRVKAHKHIKQLLENAKNIFVYDKYIGSHWTITKELFEELIPKKNLTIFYTDNHFTQKNKTDIKQICKLWKIKEDTLQNNHNNLHDRYLIIDNKIEIILTSGFEYLFDDNKEFTYILKEKCL